MNPYYTDYAEYLNRHFPGIKVQKLSVNGNMSCPNRDGTLSTGGCIYCDNRSFSPEYTRAISSVEAQLAAGRKFFARKYPNMKYLAYFQNYTSTYGGAERLHKLYDEALCAPDVVGLVIGTRPDMLPEETLALLEETARRTTVMVELGVESSFDTTLETVNRHHTFADAERAIANLSSRGIDVGVHLIAGLPGETGDHVQTTIDRVCALPVSSIKLHQMQVIAGTELAHRYAQGTAHLMPMDLDAYLQLCVDVVRRVPRRVAIERFVSQAPSDMLIYPRWGLKNHEFTHRLHSLLKKSS